MRILAFELSSFCCMLYNLTSKWNENSSNIIRKQTLAATVLVGWRRPPSVVVTEISDNHLSLFRVETELINKSSNHKKETPPFKEFMSTAPTLCCSLGPNDVINLIFDTYRNRICWDKFVAPAAAYAGWADFPAAPQPKQTQLTCLSLRY